MMAYRYLLYQEEERLGFISLNRPEKRNVLSRELLEELTALLQKIGQAKRVKVVVIKGIGKIFSAGHDLKEIADGTPQDVLKLFQTCFLTMRAIREIPQPVIAQVHGVATAAGCQLVAAADLAVAAEDALFATPGVKIGLFCTTPAVFLSRNVGRKKAMEMLLTGEFMPAREALIYGLVNKVVPPGELEAATRELAGKIAQYSLSAIGAGKRAFYQQINMEDFQALNYATEVISLNTTTVDAQEGIRAFLEKREPSWSDN
ncbi:enoyl-CoA hydratase [Desulfofundulus thermosubterraneus]|uniref:Enoyl-CoA hydratase domain-containing protein 3, mitochondrial n=1 Tax=Desulfofundulus thermosubterraneus DSM 16057 TaxID=1121432 RepID=A0A1M6JRK2_9FIRM|nr:enoyl-CoA hydratase [Desulfofundulus thermosubterraneus]SHJ49314.1 Enoyl-CoA hydratase/carnithine racemase [Desulfofundulus thermosubterraneus DSM 16057]